MAELELTKKDMHLRNLLYELECPIDNNYTKEQRDSNIALTVLAAKECGVTDKAIEMIEANQDKTFHEIAYLIYVSKRIFPELETVDDDELDDDEK